MQGLYALKPWYARQLRGTVGHAVVHRISPDVYTAVGVAAAACAAVAVANGWWPAALAFLAVRLAGANLDGAVARARGISAPWGFVVNELGDRASDVLMFAGLSVWAGANGTPVAWVLTAALAATQPTFAALAGAGAGAARRNGGPFGKTERCLAVVIATALPQAIPHICVVVVAGSMLTASARLRAARRELAG
ncbi:CDP-alcohol phosphatidyltransferase family protein [Mycobacterium sp. NPDC050551]|uniref:CDP-alcohol phosphatidyltransferase family protein n=1 Tax=Mycobacterium sp. NPDC050551 TaxID=3155407 RepID=UPI0034131396